MTLMPEDIEELEKLYSIAKDGKKDTFTFKGQLMDVNYTKYLLEYLKGMQDDS